MTYELRQDVFHKVLAAPHDPEVVAAFVLAQARAIHASRHHASTCRGYGGGTFEGCGVRWCRAARAIAGTETRPEFLRIPY